MCMLDRSANPMDGVDRRAFLRAALGAAAAVGAAGVVGGLATPAAAAEGRERNRNRVPLESISIQLYTMRDRMAADLDGTLQAVRDAGYRKVELAGTYGRDAATFKSILRAHGLHATSSHNGIPQPFDADSWRRVVEDAVAEGQQFLVHPYQNYGADLTAWAAFARDLNQAGAIARAAGLRFGYHNHAHEFRTDAGPKRPYDVLLAETDPRLVHFELDLYWSWKGGQDPVPLLLENKHRFRQFHVKDMNSSGGFADPGTGVIDFGRIFDVARKVGIEEYTVERDDAGANAVHTAQVGYDFLRDIRF